MRPSSSSLDASMCARKHRTFLSQWINHKYVHKLRKNRIIQCFFFLFLTTLFLKLLLFATWKYSNHNDIPQSIKPSHYSCAKRNVLVNAASASVELKSRVESTNKVVASIASSRHPFTLIPKQKQNFGNDGQEKCDITFAIISACFNTKLRHTIRETWGRYALLKGCNLLFFVGSHEKCVHNIKREQNAYHDVEVLDVLESYNSLSFKTRAMLSFMYSKVSKYVAKVDDDVYVDVEAFLGKIRLYYKKKYLYMGYMHTTTCVIRVSQCKWYDPSFPRLSTSKSINVFGIQKHRGDTITDTGCKDTYPSYAGGMFYVLSRSTLSLLSLYDATSGSFKNRFGSTLQGIKHLPVWSNEDATVGTWIHAAMRHLPKEVYKETLVHEPAVFPSRMVRIDSPIPPMVLHMEWATGQHVKRKGTSLMKELMTSSLLYAADSNLKWEGLIFSACLVGIQSILNENVQNTDQHFVFDNIKIHENINGGGRRGGGIRTSNHDLQEDKNWRKVDVHTRKILYEKPSDMYQDESAQKLEKICSGR